MNRRALRHLALSASVVALACGGGIDVDLAHPAGADSLAFTFSAADDRDDALSQVSFLSLRRCSGEGHGVYWLLRRSPGSDEALPSRLEYGRTPSGWNADAVARALELGCYQLSVDGSDGVRGGMTFVIDSVGRAARQ